MHLVGLKTHDIERGQWWGDKKVEGIDVKTSSKILNTDEILNKKEGFKKHKAEPICSELVSVYEFQSAKYVNQVCSRSKTCQLGLGKGLSRKVMGYASSLLTGPCLYVSVCTYLHGSEIEVSWVKFYLHSGSPCQQLWRWKLISDIKSFIVRAPEIWLLLLAILEEQWFSWCGRNFHSSSRSFRNHECFYFKMMSTFVAMVWNLEFLIKELQVIKIYFRHVLHRNTHWKLYRLWFQNLALSALCIQKESLEGGMLSEWQECVPRSHLTNTVRVNLPWSKQENICI